VRLEENKPIKSYKKLKHLAKHNKNTIIFTRTLVSYWHLSHYLFGH